MLNAAVIGVGAMGKNHARVYSELKNVKLAAVTDIIEERAKQIASKFGANYYTDYKEMIKNEKLDLVSVVIPTKLHKTVSMDTISAGIHTLVEKPMASSTAEAKEMIGLARKNGKILTVGHIERFNPMIIELKNQIKKLGKIYSVEIRRTGPFPERIRDVGVIVDLGVHDFDIMRFILGSEPRRIYAEVQQNVHTAFEDLAKIVMKFESNSVGTLDLNWLTPKKTREIIVLGEQGMLNGDFITQRLEFYKYNGSKEYEYEEILKGVVVGKKEEVAIKSVEPLRAELESFVNCILNGNKPVVTMEDGLAALKIAEMVMESACAKKVIYITS
jgi:predicted dehydrogenase